MDCSAQLRRHNPVDSICRKLQTIQRYTSDSPFYIPKLSSSSYDSPQAGLKQNLESFLKKRTVRGEDGIDRSMLTPTSSPKTPRTALCPSTPAIPSTPASTIPTPTNATFTITSTLGERRGQGQDQFRGWQRTCSTPATQSGESYFSFSQGGQFTQPEGMDREREGHRNSPLSLTHSQAHSTLSYNLNFCSGELASPLECELPYPALVVKRLSMGGDGSLFSEARKEAMAEVSLICEEDLLDTIFHACDTQRRGKVYVSRIVDYLRHTTSRGSEDSGLDDLCNMLDPEHKNVSIDLDTYHAVMKEWIDDCRNSGDESAEELTQDSVRLKESLAAKRSVLLNMTSGSLEAFGGEASRGDLETSDLVYCVADLQFSNQKLQQDVRKLKQAMEAMEDTNLRLAEENEQLRSQAKMGHQLAQKEKLLKEEVEEMKMTLSCTEEGRARASAHSKHMERENQSLIAKIASLQEENIKVTMEMDDLQKRMMELCDLNAELQVQIHSYDGVVNEKDSLLLERSSQIKELRAALEEYSSVTELLRADKSKLASHMHLMQPDMSSPVGLSLSVAYRLNQITSGSLQTELALAQNPIEVSQGAERLSSNLSFVSPMDETLDKEVLLLFQGPSPEHMSQEFKNIITKLKREFDEEGVSVLVTLRGLLDQHGGTEACDPRLQTVQCELDARRTEWALSLEQLDQYTDSLEKELIKMASNMRRSRTEILHLSVRVQEQENQKQQLKEELEQLKEELEQLKTPQDSREASCQTPVDGEELGEDLDWDEEFALQDFLRAEVDERYRDYRPEGPRGTRPPGDLLADQPGEEGEERWTVVGGEGSEVQEEPRGLSPPPRGTPPGQSTEGEEADAVTLDSATPPPEVPAQDPSSSSPDQDRTLTPGHSPPGHSPPGPVEMVSPSCTSPVLDETTYITGSSQPPGASEDGRGEGGGEDTTAGSMSNIKRLSQDQLPERVIAEDSTSLLPVLEEEEEGMHESAQVPTVNVDMAGTDRLTGEGAASLSDENSPQTVVGQTISDTNQSEGRAEGIASDPSQSEDSPALQEPQGAKKLKKELVRTISYPSVVPLINDRILKMASVFASDAEDGVDQEGGERRGKPETLVSSGGGNPEVCESLRGSVRVAESLTLVLALQELSRSMVVTEGHKPPEDLSEASGATEKDAETSVISEDNSESMREERNSLSQNEKEIETEFQRLSLGFKCDVFTLEKRLRLEERSRDLAEDNVRREVSSCQGLLQALIPLCEDDNQSMEIIQRLQKNLDILIQSMTRVSSRSEMLGAIHQESRIGKAVEVMIQHVENLRRMYTKEHTELLELRETMMQNERSFGSHSDRDDFRGKKQTGSQFYKSSSRRVSIAAIPRSSGAHYDMPKALDISETDAERLTRRSPWNVTGKGAARPPLKRFVSSGAWAEVDEPTLMMKGSPFDTDSPSEEEHRGSSERKSSLTELGNKLTSLIMPKFKTPNPASTPNMTEQAASSPFLGPTSRPAVARTSRGVWLWLALVVVLAALLALLASLVMQPAVDAAPVGTGDSWMTIQQLLWPYTGLRHNGQPPV
ncbi:inositol 1,4,5-triphosphate receptor associated 2 [Osmerus mordax]|uniref:inositol 1,4,5-triphosphate receptor associated 2 n=1 Tax=Osmerus mordax TaxID=8014 RepID=UPI003510718C